MNWENQSEAERASGMDAALQAEKERLSLVPVHALVGNPTLDCKKEHVQHALDIAVWHKRINTSMVQRRLRLGYAAASRILDELELQGFIGSFRTGEGREVLCISNSLLDRSDPSNTATSGQ